MLGAVLALAFADGGFFPTSWGWSAIGLCAAAGVALLLRERVAVGRLEIYAFGLLAALAAWIALSILWSDIPNASRLETERVLVYVAALGAALVVVNRGSVVSLLAGFLGAVTALSAYSLIDRAVSGERVDPFQGALLFEPIGYANALGVLAAMGIVLALGLAVRAHGLPTRALLAGVTAVLAPTLYLTDSRGASIALGAGVAALAAGEFRRLDLAIGALPVVLGCVLAAVVAGAVDIPGDRPEYWRVAWREAELNPSLGGGAGTFYLYWLLYRSTDTNVQDAHSLYLEALAELGPVGLVLLLCALAVPLVAALRVKSDPLIPAATGAYVVFLTHAAQDWDWEMPAVTVAGVFCGGALLVAARPDSATAMTPLARARAGALSLALGGVALAGLVANL